MLRWTRVVAATTSSITSASTDMSTKRVTTAPVVSPAVVRSLYRRLYKEVCLLDADPIAKFLFPQTKELQQVTGVHGPLYVPNRKYVDVLRGVFRDSATKSAKINLAFDTLNRLRAHRENVRDKLPALLKDRMQLLSALRDCDERNRHLFRAEPLQARQSPSTASHAAVAGGGDGKDGPHYVRGSSRFPARVVLGDATTMPELGEGVVLVAHPLSSTHVDRRVMMITERTALMTTAVVLDLQFTYPLSRGNPMFPEVFWGHDVYDGGFSQIGFTMPPTAHITLLHTLEPATQADAAEQSMPPLPQQQHGEQAANELGSATLYLSWRKWRDAVGKELPAAQAAAPVATPAAQRRQHELLCRPLIPSQTLPDGTREPTLYLSHVEALPYLAKLAVGQPRSSLRVYWGSMRWTTAQIEHEVANGHWIAVRVSPSFFRAYELARDAAAPSRFPTPRELRDARAARERRYGADVSLPQVFPPDQILRRRECLWDEIMYSLGGEYAALVGCNNPFAGQSRLAVPQILAPHASSSPSLSSAAAFGDESGDGALLAEEMEMEAADALRGLAAAGEHAAALAHGDDDDDDDGGVVVVTAKDDGARRDDDDDDDDDNGNSSGGKPNA